MHALLLLDAERREVSRRVIIEKGIIASGVLYSNVSPFVPPGTKSR